MNASETPNATVPSDVTEPRYDVLIMGGGLAASVCAITILRSRPETTIAIFENATEFHRKVGESASDMSAIFYNRFGIFDHLKTKQVRKTGLRFWFNDGKNDDLAKCSEYSSPSYPSLANGWHLARAGFDDFLLDEAKRLGAKVFRPARVESFDYKAFDSSVTVVEGERTWTARGTWLLDCSGRRGLVSTKMGWKKPSEILPTGTVWNHFTELKKIIPWDGVTADQWLKKAIGPRDQITGQFCGKGYWFWHIVLSDGTTSFGAVYDKRIISPEGGAKAIWSRIIDSDPVLQKLTEKVDRNTIKTMPHLPFTSERYRLPGLATVGDASAFLDPLFSPGMELTTQQTQWICPLVVDHLRRGEYDEKAWATYEKTFQQAFDTRFVLYERRYFIMGDFELFANQTQLDILGYYAALVLPSAYFRSRMRYPARFHPVAKFVYRLYTRRLSHLARIREATGFTARRNTKQLWFSGAFVPKNPLMGIVRVGELFLRWAYHYLKIEVETAILRLRTLLTYSGRTPSSPRRT